MAKYKKISNPPANQDDIELDVVKSNTKKKDAPKVELIEYLSKRVIPDFSGDAVVRIPKSVYEALSPDGTRWEALQYWLVHRDADLIVSSALNFVQSAISDGVAGNDESRNRVENFPPFYYSPSQLKELKGFMDALVPLYIDIFDSVIDSYKEYARSQVTKELMEYGYFRNLLDGRDAILEASNKKIRELNALVTSQQAQIDELKKESHTYKAMTGRYFDSSRKYERMYNTLVETSQANYKAYKLKIDKLLSVPSIRFLKWLHRL